MKNNRIIVAVIGASRNLQGMVNRMQITKMAFGIGEEITAGQQILFSGGKPRNHNPMRVHSAAMDGAQQAGTIEKPARLISVLREQNKNQIDFMRDTLRRHLVVNTNFGDERNFINGYVPDVMIAVQGGKGTFTEIAFAHLHHIPVVGIQNHEIDTLNGLKPFISILEQGAREILDKTKIEFAFDLAGLSKVDDLISGKNINITDTAKEAVVIAIKLARRDGTNDLPPNDHLNPLLNMYKSNLNELAS
jgi:hypothetical protein